MKICFIAAIITLLSSLLLNGNEAFAQKNLSPYTCAGFHAEKEGVNCLASCKEGEIAICYDTSGVNEPQCFCQTVDGDRSFKNFLKRAQAEKNKNGNQVEQIVLLQDVVFATDEMPDAVEKVVPAVAVCYPKVCQVQLDGVVQ